MLWKMFFFSSVCIATTIAAEAPLNPEDKAPALLDCGRVTLTGTDTVESLSADLRKKDAGTRMNVVRKLGALSDPESKRVLLNRLKEMPQPESASDTDQREKIAVLREVLPKLQPAEQTPLLLNTLRGEIEAMKTAKQTESDNYYPKDLAYSALAALEENGLSGDVRDELARFSADHSIPQSAREEFLAAVVRHDLEKERIRTPEEKVRSAISKISIRPTTSIPWEIYNDVEKRIAYSKTEAFRNRQKEMGTWLKSEEAVRTSAYEKLLHSFGLTAVQELVATLDQKALSQDRRDYLALLGTEILRKQSTETPPMQDNVAALIQALTKYVEGMDDAGAFSRRAYAAANLNAFCKKMNLKKRIPITPAERMTISGSNRP